MKIDKTAPEVVNAFDPATLDLAVTGRDAGSGIAAVTVTSAPAPKQGPMGGDKAVRRTYVITDKAGNETVLVEDVRKAGHELRAAKVSIRYGSGPVTVLPENELKFEWALEKDGSLKELEQRRAAARSAGSPAAASRSSSSSPTPARCGSSFLAGGPEAASDRSSDARH